MKKKIGLIIFSLVISYTISAQSEIFEGYNGIPWGTTINEFFITVPLYKEITTESDKLYNERIFKQETNSITRLYKFFDGKLYWGRTAYLNPDNNTTEAEIAKMVDTYGKFYSRTEWIEENKKTVALGKTISPSFSLLLQIIEIYDDYNLVLGEALYITYINDIIFNEAKNFAIE